MSIGENVTGGAAGADFIPERRIVTSGEATAKKLILAHTPVDPSEVLIDVFGGGPQKHGTDFEVISNEVRWTGFAWDGLITTGDSLRIQYFI